MNGAHPRRPVWVIPLVAVAIILGIASLFSGGMVLFGPRVVAEAAGETVGFVLWFNVATAPLYVVAAWALLRRPRLGAQLSVLLAIGVLVIAIALAGHIVAGGAYEPRTVAALSLRAGLWLVVATLACRAFGCLPASAH